jgi:hypothetical protein
MYSFVVVALVSSLVTHAMFVIPLDSLEDEELVFEGDMSSSLPISSTSTTRTAVSSSEHTVLLSQATNKEVSSPSSILINYKDLHMLITNITMPMMIALIVICAFGIVAVVIVYFIKKHNKSLQRSSLINTSP